MPYIQRALNELKVVLNIVIMKLSFSSIVVSLNLASMLLFRIATPLALFVYGAIGTSVPQQFLK